MILVDTSVWVEIFRKGPKSWKGAPFDIDEAVTCLPVVQEVLQGIRDEVYYRRARESLLALPILESPMSVELYERAVELYRLARRQGLTIRSSVDCLIAACALRNDVAVLHKDRDFQALARVSGLREHGF